MKLPVKYDDIHYNKRWKIRNEYVKVQKGLCYHCCGCLKQPPPEDILEKKIRKDLFPDGFFNHPVHLHHNHVTGLTIGAVHNYCNAILWQYHGE